jgi:hypothetical protein
MAISKQACKTPNAARRGRSYAAPVWADCRSHDSGATFVVAEWPGAGVGFALTRVRCLSAEQSRKCWFVGSGRKVDGAVRSALKFMYTCKNLSERQSETHINDRIYCAKRSRSRELLSRFCLCLQCTAETVVIVRQEWLKRMDCW